MLKRYIAKTNISVNIILPSGKSTHITFSPLTGGSSVFYTDDKDIQQGLKQHRKMGKLFKEDALPGEAEIKKIEKQIILTETEGAINRDMEDNKESGTNGSTIIYVSCLEDAKDYLSEKFGISRTKLRSTKAIKEAAEANGITFEGI
ncbi:hypothetical protein OCV73_02530 [Barnesiella propionica]|uniref:hypothetical protein n=1 Tax=Barnesiella propionica TaxID=2981781 RepID=UPI0011CA926A|nr:hypothetical protein [Barnesiella propionica]MCU6767834.1 hypothetical protein [Barnesiella propionica]